MKLRIAGVLAVLLAVAAGLALLRPVRQMFEPTPNLAAVYELMNNRRYEAAEPRLRRYLEVFPEDERAHLFMAQVLLDRQAPDVAGAERHLRAVRGPRHLPLLRTLQGKAFYRQERYAEAEASWRDAFLRDPLATEASWLLMRLYYLEGRTDDLRAVAWKKFTAETTPRERASYLMELARIDAQKLAAAGVIRDLEPIVKSHPDDYHANLAYGRALTREGRVDEGLAVLHRVVDQHPDRIEGWDAYLAGLVDGGDTAALAVTLGKVAASLRDDPRLAAYRGKAALDRGDYREAVAAYRTALARSPWDATLYFRLARACRYAGQVDEADRLAQKEADMDEALEQLKVLYHRIEVIEDYGIRRNPELIERLAVLRERLGRPDEAAAWRELVRGKDRKGSSGSAG